MKRAQVWALAIVSAVLAVAINVQIEKQFAFDVSSFCVLVALPVGIMALAALGLSGFLFGSIRWGFDPGPVDLGFLMCLAFGIALGIYGYQYFVTLGGLDAAQRPPFGSFVYHQITNAMITLRMRGLGAGPAQPAEELGLMIAVIKLGALPAVAKVMYSMSSSPDAREAATD